MSKLTLSFTRKQLLKYILRGGLYVEANIDYDAKGATLYFTDLGGVTGRLATDVSKDTELAQERPQPALRKRMEEK